LVLALAGAVLAGYFGFVAYSVTHRADQVEEYDLRRALVTEAEKTHPNDPAVAKTRAEVTDFEQRRLAAYFLLGACPLGIVGGVLALARRGKIACPLLLLPAGAASAVAPKIAILMAPLFLAGLLALLIRSAARAPVPGELASA
jgi:hypothetical protein